MAKFSEIELDDFGFRIGLGNGKILLYIDRYYDYYKNQFPQLIRFFNGDLERINSSVFLNLNSLIKEAEQISSEISSKNYLLYFLMDWEIVDYLDDLKIELYRMLKSDKFLRSSKTNSNFSGEIEFNHSLIQNKTLEDVAFEVKGSIGYDEDAVNIAARNNLSEVDYDLKGNKNLILRVSLTSNDSAVLSVVDNMIGEKAYGLDFQRKLEFSGDDVKILNHRETVFQSVKILADLMKGDHPGFKTFGRSPVVGRTKSMVTSPTTFRELVKVFSSDDTLVNFNIDDVKTISDSVELKFSVESRLNLIIKQNILV